jgi:chemotaxis protein CheD
MEGILSRGFAGHGDARVGHLSNFSNRTATAPRSAAVPGFEHIHRYWDAHVARWSAKILPGEYYVTRCDEVVSTVLGSCIAACVRDTETGVGGMNHFMLPEDLSVGKDAWSMDDGTPSTRYGAYAMESLINETLKLGARRERLEMKLFGGGMILPSMTDIGARNIAFANSFASIEKLKVVVRDVGGTTPRHVIFFPATGRVLLKHLKPLESTAVAEIDGRYRSRLAEQPAADDVELFD